MSDSIESKIAWAEAAYRRHGPALRADGELSSLLARLRACVSESRKAMVEAGIAAACSDCLALEGSSCCGAGIESRYDGVALLINLLLGAKLPSERLEPKGCHFLRPTGCGLIAREVICLNYLCKKVSDAVDREQLAALRDREGEELEVGFLLRQKIKKHLSRESRES